MLRRIPDAMGQLPRCIDRIHVWVASCKAGSRMHTRDKRLLEIRRDVAIQHPFHFTCD
jgi:hypothetical protein